MKKLILLLTLSIAFTVSAFSQSFKKVHRMALITYDKDKGEWVEDKVSYPNGLHVMIKGSEIIITSQSEQRVFTYGECEKNVYPKHITYSWDALDKEGTKCRFIMKHFSDGAVVYMFIYQFMGIEYLMEK
jgi:hypothetical protein